MRERSLSHPEQHIFFYPVVMPQLNAEIIIELFLELRAIGLEHVGAETIAELDFHSSIGDRLRRRTAETLNIELRDGLVCEVELGGELVFLEGADID